MLFGNKKTYVIDYETLADPRIADFVSFGLMQGKLLLPSPNAPQTKAGTTTPGVAPGRQSSASRPCPA
jgi:hypothetical protein